MEKSCDATVVPQQTLHNLIASENYRSPIESIQIDLVEVEVVVGRGCIYQCAIHGLLKTKTNAML